MFSAALCRGLIEAGIVNCLVDNIVYSFPRLYAAASLKPIPVLPLVAPAVRFSAALCRGLIEAIVMNFA